MSFMEYYNGLEKPSWTPDVATIGTVWQTLYPIIIATFIFVIVQAVRGKLPWQVTVPFIVNLVTNLAFTPIQFGLRNQWLAAADILVVWGSIAWMIVAIWKHYRWLAVAQLPYLVWVTIATVLQLSIAWANR